MLSDFNFVSLFSTSRNVLTLPIVLNIFLNMQRKSLANPRRSSQKLQKSVASISLEVAFFVSVCLLSLNSGLSLGAAQALLAYLCSWIVTICNCWKSVFSS